MGAVTVATTLVVSLVSVLRISSARIRDKGRKADICRTPRAPTKGQRPPRFGNGQSGIDSPPPSP